MVHAARRNRARLRHRLQTYGVHRDGRSRRLRCRRSGSIRSSTSLRNCHVPQSRRRPAKPSTRMTATRADDVQCVQRRADAREIVDLVRSEHVEVLALQETTDAFVDDLNRAGIASYLPYAQVSSSDGVYGNGLWSASPLDDPSDDDVDSSASFMPGGTVSFNGGATQVRFVSVHTTSPTNDYWQQWKRSLDELAKLRFDTSRRYVSWVISTRRTTIRRSATFWETVSPTLPSGRRGIEILMACECRLRAVVRRNRPYRTGFRHAGRTGAHSQSGRQRPQSAAGDCAGRLSPWLDGDDRHVIRISDAGDDVRALRFCGQHRHGELVEQLVGERSGQLSYRIRVRQPFHNREIWYVLHADPLVFQR